MNRKAFFGMGSPLVLFWTFLGYLVFLLAFAGLFLIRSCQDDTDSLKDVKSASFGLDTDFVLLNLLKTPIVVSGSRINVADFIRLEKSNKRFEPIFVQKMQPLMDDIFDKCVILCVDDEIFAYNDCASLLHQCSETSVLIPNYDSSLIRISLNPNPPVIPGGPGGR